MTIESVPGPKGGAVVKMSLSKSGGFQFSKLMLNTNSWNSTDYDCSKQGQRLRPAHNNNIHS